MFEIKLTIGLNEQTLEAINNLTASLNGKPAATTPASTGGARTRSIKAAAPAAEPDASAATDPESTSNTVEASAPKIEATAAGAKEPTLEEVRATVKKLIDAKQLDAATLSGYLSEFGAKKVPELKPEHFNSFLAKIAA